MSIKFKRLKEDDERFGHKKGDIVIVETNYDWDPEKVDCLAKVTPWNDHSFYKSQLESVKPEEIMDWVQKGTK